LQPSIFILGFQKSGTTAIANLLSLATNKSITSDLQKTIKYPTLQLELDFKLKKFDKFLIEYNDDFKSFIVKEPFLTFYMNELLSHFPQSKYVFIVRNPFDNLRSLLNRLKIPGHLSSINFDDWEELNKTKVWRLALQTKMFGYNAQNYIDALAYRWNLAVNNYLENKEKFILIRYEDFVKNKKEYIANLAQQLDLEIVNDISLLVDKQFQPKGQSNVDIDNFFGEKNIQVIMSQCERNMKKIGYTS
jgi:hypothetical protein